MQLELHKHLHAPTGPMELAVRFELPPGECMALHGPSGSGKTSTLRMIAGLLTPDAGLIRYGQQSWFDHQSGFHLPPGKRGVAFVFQDYALFPNLSVTQNLRYAAPQPATANIAHLIEAFELGDLRHHYPPTLSGGQQQRVALARALAQQPRLLLLDEPLSALDPRLRTRVRAHLQQVRHERQLTTLLVTHDEGDLRTLSNNVLSLENGQQISITPTRDFMQPTAGDTATVVLIDFPYLTVQIGTQQLRIRHTAPHVKIGDVLHLKLQ